MRKLKHWWLYAVVLFTITLLLTSNYLITARNEKENNGYTHTLRTAEEQLSLSFWLAQKAVATTFDGMPEKEYALKQLEHWTDVHYALQYADGSYDLNQKPTDGMISGYRDLNPVQKELANTLRNVYTAQEPIDATTARQIGTLQKRYYTDMRTVIEAMELQAENSASDGRLLEKGVSLLIGLILMLEIGLLVLPYHLKLLNNYNELKQRNQEIERHKKYAESLSDTQNLIITGTNAGIWEWDMVTNATFWSPRLYRMIGYEAKDMPSGLNNFMGLLHPDDRDEEEQARLQHLRYRKPYNIEVRLANKDGQYRWYEITGQAIWDAKGQPIRMAGSVIDIHDQKEYHSQLEYNEYMLREAGTLAQVGSWEYDVQTGVNTWSDTIFDINEMDRDADITPEGRFEMYQPEDRAKLRQHFNAAIHQGIPYDMETRVTTGKGNQKWVRIIARALKDENGRVYKIRGVYQDITQQKLRELQMKQMQEKLEETNATKNKLFSIIAHDLRSPINNMKSLIDMKQEGILTQEEFMTYLGQIKQNTDYLSGAMDNMLYWAMSQMEGFKVKPRKVGIADTVSQALNLYSGQLTDKQINVINNTDATHSAFADPDHTFLIIRNLLSNAIKFTPIGGDIYLESTVQGNIMRLSVQDNGAGMSEDDLKQIRATSSLHSTRGTEGEKGTGLGLSLCFEMAGLNNGGIDIISKPGKGSIFTLTLPAIQQ